jgi:hypothetical protein
MKSKNPFSHKVTFLLTEKNKDFIDWLVKQWGPGGYRKNSHWTMTEPGRWEDDGDPMTIAFRYPKDATAFALKWA